MSRRSPSASPKSPRRSSRSPRQTRRPPAATLLLVLLLPLLTTACSSLGIGEPSEREQQIAELEAQLLELKRQTTVDKVEIDRLRQKLAELEDRVVREADERAAAAARVDAPRGIEEEKVPAPRAPVQVIEVSDLEEPLEEEEPPAEITAVAPPAEARAAAQSAAETPAQIAERAPAPVTAEDGPSTLPAGAETRITTAAQALYDQGYSLYHQGRYVDAEETFQRFLAAYSATDLGDNALFWIGQSRLGRNELQSALAAFRQTAREHPEGNKAPDALLAAGQVLERLNDVEGARDTYLEVERRFPDSTAGAEAAKRRQRLAAG
jgi:tol-pal system protein YbgF